MATAEESTTHAYSKRKNTDSDKHEYAVQCTCGCDRVVLLGHTCSAVSNVPVTPERSACVPIQRTNEVRRESSARKRTKTSVQETEPVAWSAAQVDSWLHDLVLPESFLEECKREQLSGALLLALDDNNLKELGLEKDLHRKKILLAVSTLRPPPYSYPVTAVDTRVEDRSQQSNAPASTNSDNVANSNAHTSSSSSSSSYCGSGSTVSAASSSSSSNHSRSGDKVLWQALGSLFGWTPIKQDEVQAAALCQMLADKAGSSVAKALCCAYGWGMVKDPARGRQLLLASPLPIAQYLIACSYGQGVPPLGVACNDMLAVQWYTRAAEAGLDHSQCDLGFMYDEGLGVEASAVNAVKWYRQAAEQGLAEAQNNLAQMYAEGKGVAKDEMAAVQWYSRAAEQGLATAQCNLGRLYSNGHGVKRSYASALHYYTLAASQNDDEAQCVLAFMYEKGLGVTKDAVHSIHWYRLAAEQGHAYAQYELGCCVERGYGTGGEKDEAQAVQWYRRAAEQDNHKAQWNLAGMYEKGRGVAKDMTQAAQWYRRAAEQGMAQAQARMGQLYTTGEGVAKNQRSAAMWYKRAAAQGNAAAVMALRTHVWK